MVIGTGIDIVEIKRIEKALQKEAFAQRFFAQAEIAYCEARKNAKYQSYAARFAGKEAFVKALGTGFRTGELTEISIENDELGCPQIILAGKYLEIANEKGVGKVHISLSHSQEYAVAQVVLEGKHETGI